MFTLSASLDLLLIMSMIDYSLFCSHLDLEIKLIYIFFIYLSSEVGVSDLLRQQSIGFLANDAKSFHGYA